MKNKFLLGTLLMCIIGLFSACSDDNGSNPTGPALQDGSTFKVNTPAMATQFVQLAQTNTVHMTWSQPIYNYAAYISYRIQVGLPQADGSIKWNTNLKTHANAYLETVYYQCQADLSGEEIAWAISNLDSVTTKTEWKDMGARKIAFRIRATIDDGNGDEVAGTEAWSNTVYFDQMKSYNAVKEADWIYLEGSCVSDGEGGNWPTPSEDNADLFEDWKLYETEIGNKIYQGTFDIAAQDLQFRFFSKLAGWTSDYSFGPTASDFSSADIVWGADNKNTIISNALGNYNCTGFEGGTVRITVNMNDMYVIFEKVQ